MAENKIQYRVLESRTPGESWQTDGVAYIDESDECALYRNGLESPWPFVKSLYELNDKYYPRKESKEFRWAAVSSISADEFDVEKLGRNGEDGEPLLDNIIDKAKNVLQRCENIRNRITTEEQQVLRPYFISLYEDRQNKDHLPAQHPEFLKELIQQLWELWRKNNNRPLFEKHEYNVCLLLYARAYGCAVDEEHAQKEYLAQNSDLYAPIIPEEPVFGARASLSNNVLAALQSPVIQVFIFLEEETPVEVMLIGRGLKQMQDQIFYDALLTALRVRASHMDLLNDGFIYISATHQDETASDVDLPWGSSAPLSEATTIDAAFREFIRRLEQLERENGFVQVHRILKKDVRKFDQRISEIAGKAYNQSQTFLWSPEEHPLIDIGELVTMQLIRDFSDIRMRNDTTQVRPMRLALDSQLLSVSHWIPLVNAYYEETLETVRQDASVRLEDYERHYASLKAENKEWVDADQAKRSIRWGPTVTLNTRFDNETGLTCWLQRPEIIQTEKHFAKNVPGLIANYRIWADRMRAILRSIDESIDRTDTPFFRLLSSRLFDCAIRGTDPGGSVRIRKLYAKWRDLVAPLLFFEWRRKLRVRKQDPQQFFSSQTTFSLNYHQRSGAAQPEITKLSLLSYIIVDTKRSVVVCDPKGFMTVRSAVDYPCMEGMPGDVEELEQIIHVDAEKYSLELQAEKLRRYLCADPEQATKKILSILGAEQPYEAVSREAQEIRDIYEEEMSKVRPVRLVDKATTEMIHGALLSARQHFKEVIASVPEFYEEWIVSTRADHPNPYREIPDEKELQCRIYLLMALAECFAISQTEQEVEQLLTSRSSSAPPELDQAFRNAKACNQAFMEKWIDDIPKWKVYTGYHHLMRDFPTQDNLTTTNGLSIIRIFDALEMLYISQRLKGLSDVLEHSFETRENALIKIGRVVEEGLISFPASRTIHQNLSTLFQLMTGHEFFPTGKGASDHAG